MKRLTNKLSIMKFFLSLLSLFLFLFGSAPLAECRQLPQLGRSMRQEFLMDSDYVNLNHGAYGTYPKVVSRALHEFQERSEKNPDLWIRRDARTEWDKVRKLLADLISADSDDIVMVPNTTGAINGILRSMIFAFGERILHVSAVFNSMNSIIQYLINNSNGGLSRAVFNVTYPMSNKVFLQRFEIFLKMVQDSKHPIRLALIDHVTSMPAVVVPIDKMIPMLKRYNITVLVDGAHSIGQVPINITALAPDYYVTNCHKWLFAARGCALLYVNKKHQGALHPAHITSAYKQPANFLNEFFWTGTMDYSTYMTVPAALQFRQEVGGEEVIMQYNHNLARRGGRLLSTRFGTEILQDPDQTGSMIDVRLPVDNPEDSRLDSTWWVDEQLYRHPETFSPVYKHNGRWWVRVSAQIYNDIEDFKTCAQHFLDICNELNNSQNDTLQGSQPHSMDSLLASY